ncbi:putative Pyridoxamine 5'-phosphate oxidase-related, FMN-binding [metagenome]|uniref:Putative Pyridoxamine 5'-phosphate oxidase-related, FMN-binding n=1 Tax=metagenome TaxID=256318 RepID=A0A2P2C1D7_9ZZZZ
MTDHDDETKLVELLEGLPIGMLTTQGGAGLRSVPMARQQVLSGPQLWFITARDTHHVADVLAEPLVGLTFSSASSWVSLTGRAEVVDDPRKLEELWNTFAEAWLPGGPEDPNAVLMRVDVESGEYWDTPGGRIASLLSFAKTKLTGETYDTDHGVVGR